MPINAAARRNHTLVRSLVPTTFSHPAQCGERVRCPFPCAYQAEVDPYLAAERHTTPLAVIVTCRCGRAWREALL
jgi:hypothetical protein